jgi:hypothetical protein
MKKKEIERIAQTIAQNELIISSADSSGEDKQKAMKTIMSLSTKFTNLEDMMAVDERVQDILATQA